MVNHMVPVGHANAMLEVGVIGGIAYCIMFRLLFWNSCKLSLSADMNQKEGRVHFVVAISVMTCLFIGAQRLQPDLSL